MSQAYESGTMWSIWTDWPTLAPRWKATVVLVYGSRRVPVATAFGHRLIDTYVLSTRSRSRMSSRVSHPLCPPGASLRSSQG
ncbi:Uncharacterised protein [Mycobacterium tuberculosis]|nr:Uncharacterised protein [Mycobacterium tuberculosis]COX04131.1 Uncharacterised protein [Mycobacterium tuberculosis]